MLKERRNRGRGERISDELRSLIIHDLKHSEQSIYAISKKYGVSYMTVWLMSQKLPLLEKKSVTLQAEKSAWSQPSLHGAEVMGKCDERLKMMSESELRAEVERLRKELTMANLRAEALDVMIDIAEKQEGIQIRKKSGAKQS